MIFYSPYVLKRRSLANSQARSLFHEGVLIKVVDADLNFGVADLCPWPELGDQTWQQELATRGPLFQRTLELAHKDLQARKNKMSVQLPAVFKNHQTWTVGSAQQLMDATIVKIKGTRDLDILSQQIQSLSAQKIRIDFNFCLSFDEFKKWIDQLSENELKKIDVIEDPFPFQADQWSQFQNKVKLVLDFNQNQSVWSYNVCKPTRQSVSTHFEYMTSSMDHPVGLAHGLWIASEYPHQTHGFLTLDMYETTPFHSAFQQSADSISFKSDGYGIGFDQQIDQLNWIPLLDWKQPRESFLLFNPKSTDAEKRELATIYQQACQDFPDQKLILIPSSGSSKKADESVKVFIHTYETVLQAAHRVNDFFSITDQDVWGNLLPAFHVGGFSIYARGFLSGSKIVTTDWRSFNLDWVEENKVTLISLVPTQVFDLVQRGWKSPQKLRHVFVGGAALSDELFVQATELGWPIVKTYGMTETCSMIAVSDQPGHEYQLLPGVHLESVGSSEQAVVQCPSIALGHYQLIQTQLKIQKWVQGYSLPDRISVCQNRIQFLGRAQNQIKILGEGVSLDRIQSLWESIDRDSVIIHLPDERAENKLVLVAVQPIDSATVQTFNQKLKPFERIKWMAIVPQIPRSDLGKILYGQLQLDIANQELISI